MTTRVGIAICAAAVYAAMMMISCSSGGSGDDAGAARVKDAGEVATGAEGGPCFPNGTCDQDLVCASDLCVRLPDAGVDAGTVEDASSDAGSPDGGVPDIGTLDAGLDAGMQDTGVPDSGFDAGIPDTGAPDAGFPQSFPRQGKGCVDFGYDPQKPQIADTLKLGSKGTLVGNGTFTQDGFKLPATVDCNNPEDTSYVSYTIPQAECGRVEFDAIGLDNSFACQKAEEIFGMYDGSWEHPVSHNPLGSYQVNPYKITLMLHCDDPSGACSPTWAGSWFNVGNDSLGGATNCQSYTGLNPLALNPGQAQHFVVQWSGDAQNTCLLINATGNPAGGGACVPRASCGEYISYLQTITIGGTPMSPPATGATFSNLKIWWFQPQ